ncbi:MAG: small multi-drug export protein [Candidatus Saliniplasma sp.]
MENISQNRSELFIEISHAFLTLVPALTAAVIILMLGSQVYLAVSAVLLNYYFALGVGWLTSPWVGLTAGLGPWALILLLVFVAVQSSLFVSVNYDLIERVPLLGRLVKKTRNKADRVIEKHEMAKKISYVGVFWLTFLPFYGTGPMVMSFVGRILSLKWWKVWATISISAFTRYSLVVAAVYYGLF